jgi:hypothetical protein
VRAVHKDPYMGVLQRFKGAEGHDLQRMHAQKMLLEIGVQAHAATLAQIDWSTTNTRRLHDWTCMWCRTNDGRPKMYAR